MKTRIKVIKDKVRTTKTLTPLESGDLLICDYYVDPIHYYIWQQKNNTETDPKVIQDEELDKQVLNEMGQRIYSAPFVHVTEAVLKNIKSTYAFEDVDPVHEFEDRNTLLINHESSYYVWDKSAEQLFPINDLYDWNLVRMPRDQFLARKLIKSTSSYNIVDFMLVVLNHTDEQTVKPLKETMLLPILSEGLVGFSAPLVKLVMAYTPILLTAVYGDPMPKISPPPVEKKEEAKPGKKAKLKQQNDATEPLLPPNAAASDIRLEVSATALTTRAARHAQLEIEQKNQQKSSSLCPCVIL